MKVSFVICLLNFAAGINCLKHVVVPSDDVAAAEEPVLLVPRIREALQRAPDILVTDEFCLLSFRLPFVLSALQSVKLDAVAGVTEVVVYAKPESRGLRGSTSATSFTFLTPKECNIALFEPYVSDGSGNQVAMAVRRKTDTYTPITLEKMMTRVMQLHPDVFRASPQIVGDAAAMLEKNAVDDNTKDDNTEDDNSVVEDTKDDNSVVEDDKTEDDSTEDDSLDGGSGDFYQEY